MTMTCMEMTPVGQEIVQYPKYGDKIIIERVKSAMYNLLVGDRYFHHFGVQKARNVRTGDTVEIYMKEKPFFGEPDCNCEGIIKNSRGDVIFTIEGNWKTHIDFLDQRTGKLIKGLKIAPQPPNHAENFAQPLITRNGAHLNESLLKNACPTDSRFRPDLRALVNGDIDIATYEKLRLEDEQRARRKIRKEKGEIWDPRWFKLEYDADVGKETWKYKGGYFEKRKEGSWGTDFPKIF